MAQDRLHHAFLTGREMYLLMTGLERLGQVEDSEWRLNFPIEEMQALYEELERGLKEVGYVVPEWKEEYS